jgi:prepilin-type N-terminal cleavage/methylation domain-containing protein/prepilin-type processing-associated H-X9-DG protein
MSYFATTQSRCFRGDRSGFTIIELLVVISIIGILIALLLPAMTNARAYANTALCATHQKGIYTALMVYEGDFKTLPAYGSVGNLGFTDWVNPFSDPFGGCTVWGTLPAGAIGLALNNGNSTSTGPIGIGMCVAGNYMPLELVFCPEYNSVYDQKDTEQSSGSDPTGKSKNWHRRQWIYGEGYYSTDASVIALPEGDGIGLPGLPGTSKTGLYLNGTITYRGGDWSYTPSLTSSVGTADASPDYLKSSHARFPNHAVLADNRNYYHLRGMNGSNVTWGDGSVTFKQTTSFGTIGPALFSYCFSTSNVLACSYTGAATGQTPQPAPAQRLKAVNSQLPAAWFDKIDLAGR